MDEKIEKIIEGYEKYAKNSGFKLNPDKKLVLMIVKGLLDNQEKHGARYCPCRILTGDKAKDVKIICPCAYHRDEIKEMGHCHCGLFVK
jgi:ferredoxin-thioredoxin reductase catalytic subunit